MIELGQQDIQRHFDVQAAAKAVKAAYVATAQGRVQAPPVTYLGFPAAEGDCHVKTGHIAGDEAFVVKIATGFYRNPSRGLPSSNGMNLLFSAETGAPLAVLRDEGWLTDIRTGLGGALATRALAVAGFTRVLIVGAGLQARHQAQCLQNLVADRRLSFQIWARDGAKAVEAAEELVRAGLTAAPSADLATGCRNAQAIITTTPSKMPLIMQAWVCAGTHITAIGADAPGKQELDSELTARADLLVCDLPGQSLDHGEFQSLHAAGRLRDADVVMLGDVLSGAHPGRASDQWITIADLTGLAAQDAAVSLAVLRAVESNSMKT